ncbi:hypothetical protein EV1_008166 [Malus domestica]
MLILRLKKDIPKPLNRVREPFPPPNIKDVDGLWLEGGQPSGMMSCKGKQVGAGFIDQDHTRRQFTRLATRGG